MHPKFSDEMKKVKGGGKCHTGARLGMRLVGAKSTLVARIGRSSSVSEAVLDGKQCIRYNSSLYASK